MRYDSIVICDKVSNEVLSVHESEQEAINQACELRKNGNFNVKIMMTLASGEVGRRQLWNEKQAAEDKRRAEREEEQDEV
jgi:hypothetical protein